MIKHRLITTIVLLFFLGTAAFAQHASAGEINERIAQVENNLISWVKLDSTTNWNFRQRMKDMNIQGVSIAVINNYKIEWVKSYGWADTAEKRPVTNQTLFQSASIGKSVNGFAYMTLLQKKRFNLEEDINVYLKRWQFPYDTVSKGKHVTLGGILSHTAGLGVHGFDGYKWDDSLPSLVQILDGKKPSNNPSVRSVFEPGSKFEYSGGGYEISEMLAEDLTHLSYPAFIQKAVFKPLRMMSSTYALQPPPARCATAYRSDGQSIGCKYHLYPEKACGAGLWTTATDLAQFIIAIQSSLAGKSNGVLDKKTATLMLTPYIHGSEYGLGFFINKKGNDYYFQHSGLNEGFSSQYYGSMKDGKGVVVLLNSDNTDFMQEVVNSVATVYHWKDFYGYVSKKVITLPDSILNKYVGRYKFQHEDIGPVITKEDGNLYLLPPGSSAKWRMYFTSQTEFFMLEARWANQQFFMDNKGAVKGHYIIGSNSKEPVFKVEP